MDLLQLLVNEYNKAPQVYKATQYWQNYERKIMDELKRADLSQLRSGKYPVFATFGFNEAVYHYRHNAPLKKKLFHKFVRFLISNRRILPYSLGLTDLRTMAYRHADIMGSWTNATPITEIETSTFGNPQDLFVFKDKKYTMRFLTCYVRYCFAKKFIPFKGDEIIVELGSGSGHQVEVLKKAHPGLTILCFDLPAQVYLCEQYLSNVLDKNTVVSSKDTMHIRDLNTIERGKVYMFGNWMTPLLKNFKFDIFWNAASFGEMEPDVVMNYIDQFLGNCQWIFLLQAQRGKEKEIVKQRIRFEDYVTFLKGYELLAREDAYDAHKRLSQSGGYFQAVWRKL